MTTPPDDATPRQDAVPPLLHEHLQRLAESLFAARLRARDLAVQLDEVQRAHISVQRAAGALLGDDAEG